jgi:hypothetical protein
MGIVSGQPTSYPHARGPCQSYPLSGYTPEAGVRTVLNNGQVLDKKGENGDVHSEALPLSNYY